MSRLIGLFGGTFDPIHQGHIKALKLLCDEIPFTQINWMLSASPPHKDKVSVSTQHRFAMLELALANEDRHTARMKIVIRPMMQKLFAKQIPPILNRIRSILLLISVRPTQMQIYV